MIEILDPELYKRFGEVKIANATELQDLTGRGWQLICLLQEKQVNTEQREVKCRGGGNGHYCSHQNSGQCYSSDWVSVPFETDVTSFVLGRDKDTTLADLGITVEELREQLADAESDAVRLEMERSCAHDRSMKAEKNNADLAKTLEAEHKKSLDQAAIIAKHLQTINLMEGDLAKVRTEFGAKAVAELLK